MIYIVENELEKYRGLINVDLDGNMTIIRKKGISPERLEFERQIIEFWEKDGEDDSHLMRNEFLEMAKEIRKKAKTWGSIEFACLKLNLEWVNA